MSPVMTFRIAFKALGRNKMRTGLTMLGMIIGVSAVITLVAMGNGAQSMIEDQIKGAGTNMITVNCRQLLAGRRPRRHRHVQHADRRTMPTRSGKRDSRRAVPGRRAVQTQTQVVAGNQNWFTRIQGTDVDLPLIRAWPTTHRRVLQRAGRHRAPRRSPCSARRSTTRCSAPTPIRSARSSGSGTSRSR